MLNKICFAVITFAFLAFPKHSAAQLIDKIIAKVDNQIILQSELEQAYLQFLSQQQGRPPADMKCKVLETLIINKLMLAKAEIDSVTVDRETVNSELDRRMSHFVAQVGGDPKKLEEYYGKTVDELKVELRKLVREQMIIQKMQDNITNKIKVTPAEVRKFFNEIPKDSLPYFSTEAEVGQIVKIPEITKEQKLIAKETAERIRERIIAGEDFCNLAKNHSEDVGSANLCGEIGWFQKGDLVTSYEAAALALKPGEISPATESEYGYHIIQLIERRGNEFNSRHILIKPNTSEKDIKSAYKFLDSLRNKILKDSITFEKAANKFSDDKETAANGGIFIDPASGDTRIPLENMDPAMFFIIDTMKVGQISSPMIFRLEDNETEAVRIIYYKSKIPPHQASLKIDYQKIYKAALTEKKNNAVNEWFDKTKNEVYIDIDAEFSNCDILTTQ
jgi:peptidyl-prolyl cis-trans isomerase SurA